VILGLGEKQEMPFACGLGVTRSNQAEVHALYLGLIMLRDLISRML